jgi:hypothetical protein
MELGAAEDLLIFLLIGAGGLDKVAPWLALLVPFPRSFSRFSRRFSVSPTRRLEPILVLARISV